MANTPEERSRVVSLLLKRLGLEEVAHRRAGRLSGGQRKRLSVAVELVNFPPVLYVDEPTSGLDSVSSYRLLRLLKEIAMAGGNIHQPNSKIFHMFDTLLILAKGGRCAYQGPTEYLVQYMQICQLPSCPLFENPAEFVFEDDNIEQLVKASKSLPAELRRTGASKHDAERPPTPPKRPYRKKNARVMPYTAGPAGIENGKKNHKEPLMFDDTTLVRLCSDRAKPLTQFFVLLHRSFIVYFRNTASFLGRILAAVFCTVLLGVAFQGVGNDAVKVYSNVALLFFLNMMSIAPPIITAIMNGPSDFAVVLRENINGWYNLSIFYWAKCLADVPFQLFISWILPMGTWFLSHQLPPAGEGLTMQIFVLALVTILSQGLGFSLGIVADERSAMYLPFGVVLLTWIFGGYIIPFDNITPVLSWMHYFVYGFASYWALLKLAYLSNLPLSCSFIFHPLCQKFKRGYDILAEYQVPISPIWDEVTYLFIYALIVFLLGWGLLTLLIYRAKRQPCNIG